MKSRILFLSVGSLLFFSSCSKDVLEESDLINEEQQIYNQDSGDEKASPDLQEWWRNT